MSETSGHCLNNSVRRAEIWAESNGKEGKEEEQVDSNGMWMQKQGDETLEASC